MNAPSPPQIFDRQRLRQARVRAARAFAAHDFLHRLTAESLLERLDGIRRPFVDVLVIGAQPDGLVAALRAQGRRVTVMDATPAFAPDLVGEEDALPLAPQSFDLILSNLGLQYVNDLPGALVQLRRALRPDGLLLAALLGEATLDGLRQAFYQAESRLLGGVHPRVAPMVALVDAALLLQRMRWALPVVDLETVTVDYPDLLTLLRDLRGMGLGNMLVERAPFSRGLLAAVATDYADRAGDAGRLPCRFDVLFLHGWAPHDSQQKPLAPGQGQISLADVLGAARDS